MLVMMYLVFMEIHTNNLLSTNLYIFWKEKIEILQSVLLYYCLSRTLVVLPMVNTRTLHTCQF